MGVELDSAAVIQALKRGQAMMTTEAIRAAAAQQETIRREMTDRWTKYERIDRFETQLRMVVALTVYFPALVIAAVLYHHNLLSPGAVLLWVVLTTLTKRAGNMAISKYIRREYDLIDAEYDRGR